MYEINATNLSNFYTTPSITTSSDTDSNIEYTADNESEDNVLDDSLLGPFFSDNNKTELYDRNKNGVYEELDYYDLDDNMTYYANFNDTTGKLQSYTFFESNMPQLIYIVTKDENDCYSVEVKDSRSPLLRIAEKIRECFTGPQEFNQELLKNKADYLQYEHDKYSDSEYEEIVEEPDETKDAAVEPEEAVNKEAELENDNTKAE